MVRVMSPMVVVIFVFVVMAKYATAIIPVWTRELVMTLVVPLALNAVKFVVRLVVPAVIMKFVMVGNVNQRSASLPALAGPAAQTMAAAAPVAAVLVKCAQTVFVRGLVPTPVAP